MTLSEFSNEFDILYNNISSNSAPGVTEYEKSVFLTMAQDDIIKELYRQYEQDEEVRQYLQSIVINLDITKNEFNNYILPDNLMFIVGMYKQINNKQIPINTVPIDQYLKTKDNPFKNSDNRLICTIHNNVIQLADNITRGSDTQDTITLIYIKNPNPIILTELEGVTIKGFDQPKDCELSEIIHYDIVKRAVQLALTTNGIAAQQNV